MQRSSKTGRRSPDNPHLMAVEVKRGQLHFTSLSVFATLSIYLLREKKNFVERTLSIVWLEWAFSLSLLVTDVCCWEKALMALESIAWGLLRTATIRAPPLLSFGPICHNVWGKWYRAAEPGARMHLWHAQFVTGEGKGQFLGRPANLGRGGALWEIWSLASSPRHLTALYRSHQRFLGLFESRLRVLWEIWYCAPRPMQMRQHCRLPIRK